jgi:3-dehydroquinate dehydratase I
MSEIIVGLVTPEYLASDPRLQLLGDCDWAEFRGDLFSENHFNAYVEFVSRCPIPVLHTLRLQCDGGQWPNDRAAERIQVWQDMIDLPDHLRPVMIDIEIEAFETEGLVAALRPVRDAGVKLLTSHHQFHSPYSLEVCREWLKRLEAPRPDGVKMAVQAADAADCNRLLGFAHEVGVKHELAGIFAMGKVGQATRLLSPLVGCPLTYGTLSGAALAPGQMTVQRLRQGIRHLGTFFHAERTHGRFETLNDNQIERLMQAALAWLDAGQDGVSA